MIQKEISDKINGYGAILRFITPILIIVIGYLLNLGMLDVKKKLDDFDLHFTNHLNHHQQLEVGYERRLSILETRKE